jgi:hypothetical protein
MRLKLGRGCLLGAALWELQLAGEQQEIQMATEPNRAISHLTIFLRLEVKRKHKGHRTRTPTTRIRRLRDLMVSSIIPQITQLSNNIDKTCWDRYNSLEHLEC